MKCGLDKTTCMARQGDQCLEHMFTDTPSCKSRVPATNFDRLRAMSDEELAGSRIHRDFGLFYAIDVPGIIFTSLDGAIKAELEWGRQPYKEEQHGA